ncbi:MAG: hypothetical protein HDR43_03260 [Mycoplasma sp.]|nr:hypothetical protein [Mycoplasma sp.]
MIENQKRSFFSKYRLEITDVRSKLLNRSLLWMSLGLMVIILVAWISSVNDNFRQFVTTFSLGSSWLFSWIFNLIIIFALFWSVQNTNINIVIPLSLYVLFAVYEGMFITSILIFTGTVDVARDLILYIMIPAGIFTLMGVIGYLNLINFSKLIPFSFFGFISILVLSFVMIFTSNKFIESLYFIIAGAVFIIWIGFDIQMIGKTQQMLPDYVDKKTINRISFMFGIKLFIDFVNLLMLIIRFLGFGRN